MEPTYASIARVLFRYAQHLDEGDLDGMAAMFEGATLRTATPDGIVTFSGAAEVLAAFGGGVLRYEGGTLGTRHVTTNLVVDEEPDGRHATARSYFTVLQARPTFPLQVVAAGSYEDRLAVGADGTWHFVDRLIRLELVGDTSHHLKPGPPSRTG